MWAAKNRVQHNIRRKFSRGVFQLFQSLALSFKKIQMFRNLTENEQE